MNHSVDMEVIMKTHLIWKTTFAAIFIVAILALVSAPALAAGKAKEKEKEKVAASVQTPPQTHQEKVKQILADTSGPPIDDPREGYYYKVVPGNGKYIVNYFKNGHKKNQSGWIFCGEHDCPYGQ